VCSSGVHRCPSLPHSHSALPHTLSPLHNSSACTYAVPVGICSLCSSRLIAGHTPFTTKRRFHNVVLEAKRLYRRFDESASVFGSVFGLAKPTTGKDAHTWIETVKVECLNRYGNRAGSMRAVIADRIAGGWSTQSLLDLLGMSFGSSTQRHFIYAED
jgi:hypothetical protein